MNYHDLHGSRIRIRDLVDFIMAAEKQNLTKVAKEFHDEQANISRHIDNLEEFLEADLFESTANSVILNEKGKVFLKEARAAISHLIRGVQSVNAENQLKELCVGFAPSLASHLLPKAIQLFEQDCPDVTVDTRDLSSAECIQRLSKGILHLALMVEPAKRYMRKLVFEKITSIERRCLVPASHRFSKKRSVSFSKLKHEPFLALAGEDYPEYGARLRKMFKEHGRPPRIAGEYDSVTSLIAGVEAQRGVAIVAASISLGGAHVKLLQLDPHPEPIDVGVVYNVPLHIVARKFVASIKKAAALSC
jgi:DNA-binding transcriptional LysR family regulator